MDSGSSISLDRLTQLSSRADVDMRPTLIRALTDLYVQKLTHSPDEEKHFTELALRLLDSVDVATRTAVATRLARHLAPPWRVIKRLAADLPAVADAVRNHPAVRADQVAVAADDARPDDREPADLQQLRALLDQSALPVADLSAPIPAALAAELNELFFAATAEERRLILLNLEVVAPFPQERGQPARAGYVQKLETAALTGSRRDFACHLAEALDLPPEQAARIAADELGEPLVVAAKALGMPRDVVYRLLLFVNSTVGHSVERVHALANLFDEIPRQAAAHLVAIWQALGKAERNAAKHQPLLWNDETRVPARTASVSVRRAPSNERVRARRDAS